MIGSEHIHDALLKAPPDALAMRTITDGRVHLGARAEPLVAGGRLQCQVVGRCLNRSDVLVVTEKLHLLRGRDVQNMDALTGLVRESDKALRAGQRRHIIAPDRMRARIALHTQVLALAQSVLILGVERGTAPDDPEDIAYAIVVLNQQRAGRRAHEYLHTRAAW